MKSEYVIITAVRNEAKHLPDVIASVLDQTVLPLRWVIVSNNSTDGTDEIGEAAAARTPFIRSVCLKSSATRDYAAKVKAWRTGFEELKALDFNYVGNLDGDITLPHDYYERVFAQMSARPRLGVAGGAYVERVSGRYRCDRLIEAYPPGAAQVFRRACYEEIGGYLPLPAGGEDSAASIMARMNGWETSLLPSIHVMHHRPWGTGGGNHVLRGRLLQGKMDYHLGMHPIFAVAKAVARITESPRLTGSCFRLAGFTAAWLRRERRRVSSEFVKFVRTEQMERMRPAWLRHRPSVDQEWTHGR